MILAKGPLAKKINEAIGKHSCNEGICNRILHTLFYIQRYQNLISPKEELI